MQVATNTRSCPTSYSRNKSQLPVWQLCIRNSSHCEWSRDKLVIHGLLIHEKYVKEINIYTYRFGRKKLVTVTVFIFCYTIWKFNSENVSWNSKFTNLNSDILLYISNSSFKIRQLKFRCFHLNFRIPKWNSLSQKIKKL